MKKWITIKSVLLNTKPRLKCGGKNYKTYYKYFPRFQKVLPLKIKSL